MDELFIFQHIQEIQEGRTVPDLEPLTFDNIYSQNVKGAQ